MQKNHMDNINRLKEPGRAGAPLQPPSPPSLSSLADHSNVPQENHSNGAHPSQSQASPVSTGSQQAVAQGALSPGVGTRFIASPVAPATMDDEGSIRSIQQRCREEVSLSQFYSRLTSHGIQLASSFQGIEQLWRRDGEALGKIRIPRALEQETDAYQIHPALLDACFQVLIAALPANVSTTRSGEEQALYLPAGLRSFRMHHQPGKNIWSHAVLRLDILQDTDVFEGDVHLLEEGQVIVEALGLRLQRSEGTGLSLQQATQIDQFCYEIRWETASLEHTARLTHSGAGTWLIFMDSSGVGQRLAHLLAARGDSCIKIFPGYTYRDLQRIEYSVNPAYPEYIQRVIDDALASNSDGLDKLPCRGIIHLWSLDATSTEETGGLTLDRDQALGTGSALSVVQALANRQGLAQDTLQTRLWLVTRGAQQVDAEGKDAFRLSVAQSPLWGLGKTIAIEHPELWGGLVDVDPLDNVDAIATQLLTILSHQHGENQVAFREGQSYVARLVRSSNQLERSRQDLTIRADASYLITGGLWGLGFEVARWLAKKGAQHLVLLGRTRVPPRTEWDSVEADSRLARQIAGIRELEGLGVHVHYASVDVTNEQQLASFLHNFRNHSQQYPPIRGIMHAASVWQDEQGQSLVRPLIRLDQDAVRAVFLPKVTGSWHLHKLFQDTRLDFFVLFSSGASLFGSAAQGNYAAAGAFQDVLAHYLRAKGQPALSINWGAVSEAGFGTTREGLRVQEYWESHGIQRITPQQVLDALELLIPQDISQIGVLKLDWRQLRQFYPQMAGLPLFAHIATEIEDEDARSSGTQREFAGPKMLKKNNSLLQKLPSLDQEERQQLVESYLSEKVTGVLRLPASGIDARQPLTSLGLDSLMAIEMKNKIELELNVHIPIVTLLQGPSIRQFATQLLSQLAESAGASPVPPIHVMIPMEELHQTTQELEVDHNNLTSRLDQETPDRATNDSETPLVGAQFLAPNVEEHDGSHFYVGIHSLSQQEAAQLLVNIEQLSDSDVDALLQRIVQEEGLNQ
jgi:phthiocerol/phenolphthiocerol synthesis type-I polyketide synthase D